MWDWGLEWEGVTLSFREKSETVGVGGGFRGCRTSEKLLTNIIFAEEVETRCQGRYLRDLPPPSALRQGKMSAGFSTH